MQMRQIKVLMRHILLIILQLSSFLCAQDSIESNDVDNFSDSEKVVEDGFRLLELASPIISRTLEAEVYQRGCEASIYRCDSLTSTLEILRFANKNGTYVDAYPEGEAPSCKPRPQNDRRIAILVHSFLACSQKWHETATKLSKEGYDVILPLLAGHGASESQKPNEIHFVPKDTKKEPVRSQTKGYGSTAKTVRELTVTSLIELGYNEVLIGGFSAGGTVVLDALMQLTQDKQLTAEDFKKLRLLHVATFLETPDKVIQAARDFYPLLWINKLRMKGQWFDIERYSGHPWRLFQERGRRGYLMLTRSTQMRLLRYITKVRRSFKKLKENSRSSQKKLSFELIQSIPTLAVVLMNDVTIVVDQLLDLLSTHHRKENYLFCGFESNHPTTEMCGTCCDENHCSWFNQYADVDPITGKLLHTPDCHKVKSDSDLSLPEFDKCGGSGRFDVYPDGLNHDTMLDEQSRSGKSAGWWIECNQDLIVRFALESRENLEKMGIEGNFKCSDLQQCSNFREIDRMQVQKGEKKHVWGYRETEL